MVTNEQSCSYHVTDGRGHHDAGGEEAPDREPARSRIDAALVGCAIGTRYGFSVWQILVFKALLAYYA